MSVHKRIQTGRSRNHIKVLRLVVAALILREDTGAHLSTASGPADGAEVGVSGRQGGSSEKAPSKHLRRELDEELGIAAEIGKRIAHTRHTYRSGSAIDLQFFAVHQFAGEITNHIFNDLRWCPLPELTQYDFLAADRTLIRDLAAGKLL